MRIELPQVGESVTEGIIGLWLKHVGDQVEKYDPLVEVVTDKVSMEMPSPVSGVLVAIMAREGQRVPMGTVIAEIRVKGERPSGIQDAIATPDDETPMNFETVNRTGVLLKDVAPVGPTGSGGPAVGTTTKFLAGQVRTRYSPVVQRLAEEYDVDLDQIAGTGMNGRVTRRDIQAFIDVQAQRARFSDVSASSADEEHVPLTPVRRMIAENMVKSATQIPQAWSLIEVDVTGLVRLRESARDDFQLHEGIALTYMPFFVKAIAESLKENPLLNSSWGNDSIVVKRQINIGVAVAAPDGLVVPVIHDADGLSVTSLAKLIDQLVKRARTNSLRIEDVQGGTFTVNNTGALASVASQPLINYPQAAILTTEAVVRRPVVFDDSVTIRSVMNVCLAFDHRVIDGSEACAFIDGVKRRLEAICLDTVIH